MSEEIGLVYVEPLSVKVAQFLKEKGFQAASESGVEIDSIMGRSDVGILYKDPARKPKKYLWGLITGQEPRRIFLCVIYLGTKSVNAHDSQWDIKMWGKDYFEIAKNLGEALAKEFKIKIVLSVEGDEAKEEYHRSSTNYEPSDGYC